ncbi:GTPase HflX [Corallococcus praedator]|uniref:GTPase HflX n=1 Tax=Corallococcus praedator TaxID=2316724 RepID=A0ABX9Q8X0_9BACT|nr:MULTISPECIES: GTPase HflX [Corallococcus]RKH05433.1 GTPase HflX [Corallococcus sp. CA047B]RKH30966.1 GTPase HflX [Corallococcus sp. CA031C]RKH94213.1 GTPase HflX [Corallococcus praedator]
MKEIFGNTLGLKSSEQQRLRNTFRRRVDPREIVSAELARHLTELSHELNRQVGVLINRKGDIEHVVVGNAHKLELPDIGRARAGQIRLRGLRLVHTHLKSEPLTKDDLTDLALLRLDCVAAVGVGQEGLPGVLHYAYLVPENGTGEFWQVSKLPSVHVEQPDVLATLDALEEEFNRKAASRTVSGRERAILVAVCLDGNRARAESSLAELKELARTAGVEVMDSVLQVRREADPRYLIGRGKLDDLNLRSMQSMVDLLIFDKDLTPSQGRHIGDATSLKVLDRTQLILDIFAQRAQTAEGKLQVELAQQKYRLPRLVQGDDSLSRLMGGGVGGRGPGETKLEIDRRRVRERITNLEKRIDLISRERSVRRAQRNRREVPVISIVGYTNAGKSTLLNAITNAEVLAEDKLFATLDPTSRRLRFPQEREVIITDTVGFIRDLPKDLVAAFRATLEELYDASLLLHVVDAGDPARDDQVEAVETILNSLGLMEKPRLMVWNKADLLPADEVEQLLRSRGGVAISAAKREGLATLLAKADTTLFAEGASESIGVV